MDHVSPLREPEPIRVLAEVAVVNPAVRALMPGLKLHVEIALHKTKRRRCPRCLKVRVLFQLRAVSWDRPTTNEFIDANVGGGLCAECAGFRR